MPVSISIAQARKLILHSQKLPPSAAKGSALSATLAAVEALSYVQIDTISVIQRAHHHTLWTRNPRYKTEHLDTLLRQQKVFEYWSHAAAYLPIQDYRYSLFRKHAMATGQQQHWYPRNPKLMRHVLARITSEGPLMAKDFEHRGEKMGDWQSKPAKQALEYLFMQGDLMIPRRNNFHKVYDLTERVLPSQIDDRIPTGKEYAEFLIRRFLKAHGIARVKEFSYLLKQVKPHIQAVLGEMLDSGDILKINIEKSDLRDEIFALPESLELLNKPLQKRQLKILSPFDNLLIQRQRMTDFFDFDYQIECYVPQKKRQFGYFVLPILWLGKFAGRLDCKADRSSGVLKIHRVFIEQWVKDKDSFLAAFNRELISFIAFNDCQESTDISIDDLVTH